MKRDVVYAIVSERSIKAVIDRRELKPDKDGGFRITEELIAEAKALDLAAGIVPEQEDSIAFLEGYNATIN